MRFVSIALERYGHFDDCTLSFRSGETDLHVIYGANEAGKTTSMAAVSGWTCNGLVPVTCLSLCHPGFESQGTDTAQI